MYISIVHKMIVVFGKVAERIDPSTSINICGDFNIQYKEWAKTKLVKKTDVAETSPLPMN